MLGNTGLDNRLTDEGKAVSRTHQRSILQTFSCFWYSFLLEAERLKHGKDLTFILDAPECLTDKPNTEFTMLKS
jgi:hypothetical protein